MITQAITTVFSHPSSTDTAGRSNNTTPLHQHQQQQQQQQRVSFNETRRIQYVEPLRVSLTPEERETIWYTFKEMDSFHAEARTVCAQLRSKRHGFCSSEVCLRGLELRRSGQRQKRKCMTIQCVLMAQRKMKMKQEALARFAGKCSGWATDAAAVQGQRDFLLAYAAGAIKDGHIRKYLPPLPAFTPFPIPFKMMVAPEATAAPSRPMLSSDGAGEKRSCDADEATSGRCVRQRTAVF